MSLFDPHALYYRQYTDTRNGQVIRKKGIEHPGPVSSEDIKKYERVLKGLGYTISPPGFVPSRRNYTYAYNNLSIPSIQSVTLETGNYIYFYFQDLWSYVYSSFQTAGMLRFNPDDIVSMLIVCYCTNLFYSVQTRSTDQSAIVTKFHDTDNLSPSNVIGSYYLSTCPTEPSMNSCMYIGQGSRASFFGTLNYTGENRLSLSQIQSTDKTMYENLKSGQIDPGQN